MTNIAKTGEIREELSTSHFVTLSPKLELFSFRNFLLKYEPYIKDKEPLEPTLLNLTLLHGCFSHFLNCANATKSLNAPHMSLICS